MRPLLVILCLLATLCAALAATAHTGQSARVPFSSSDQDSEDSSSAAAAAAAAAAATSAATDPLPPDTFRKLAQALYQRSGGGRKDGGGRGGAMMQRKLLYDHEVTCNDGSVAGYYIRRNYRSKRWIVFLEGGWICHDDLSCGERASRELHRMSSDHWPSVRKVGGILSDDRGENPHFADANHVFVPYCSSDSWSGTRQSFERGQPSFLGSTIVRQVVAELVDFEQLLSADELFLAGSSAGATGVLVNVDAVADALRPAGVAVRGVADSGWFLDHGGDCEGDNIAGSGGGSGSRASTCSVIKDLRKGVEMWGANVPQACREAHPTQIWKCFFGYQIYPLIKAPLFIFQWQFDTFQLYADNMAGMSTSPSSPSSMSSSPGSPSQWKSIHDLGASLRRSLNNVTAVFSPSCIAHEVLTKPNWKSVSVESVKLTDAIQCWAESLPKSDGGGSSSEATATALEVRSRLGRPGLPLRDQANDIVVPVRMHSRTASMLSDPRNNYKLASNLVRSMSTSSSSSSSSSSPGSEYDLERNSINGHVSRWRSHHHRKISNNRTSRRWDRKKGHRGAGTDKHRRRRRRRMKNKHHQMRCHPESNSCEKGRTAAPAEKEVFRNGDLVRSLDRRSSQKKRRRKQRRKERRRSKRKKGKHLRSGHGGETPEKAGRRKRNRDKGDQSKEELSKMKEEKRRRRKERKRKRKERKRRRERRRRKELARTLSQMAAPSPQESDALQSRQKRSSFQQQCGSGNDADSAVVRLVDTCSWPHCNPSCPGLQNPETGQEADFLSLLESFGLDMGSVARALGVDLATLGAMDREELLHMLTSHQDQR